jgi:radical SAM/Cys-rich protein
MASPEPKKISENPPGRVPPFAQTLTTHGLTLLRAKTTVLQINLGFLCNQICRHCHLDAGPTRNERMQPETMGQVADFAGRTEFDLIDITGGAPEMHPDLTEFISMLSPLAPGITLRSNLTALYEKGAPLMNHLKANRVAIVASFPSLNSTQTDSIRGKDCFNISIDALKQLNSMGYGQNGSGLDLDLVVNPAGAFLPPPQEQLEKRFRKMLEQKWGITFNRVFSFANVPLGRFRSWLHQSDNFQKYMDKLVSAFNPCTPPGLMCRSLISVSWDGYLFDCDFNQASGHGLGNHKIHISQIESLPEPGSPIATDIHCYTCTAGSGFT